MTNGDSIRLQSIALWAWLRPLPYRHCVAGGIVAIFEDVAGLTVQRLADLGERVEAHALHLAAFQERDVLLGDANALGKLLGAHLAPRQHDIEIDDDRHGWPYTMAACSSAIRVASTMTQATASSTPPTISAR